MSNKKAQQRVTRAQSVQASNLENEILTEKLKENKEIIETLNQILKEERAENLKTNEKNSSLIVEQQEDLEILREENIRLSEQLENTKSILNGKMEIEVKDIISAIPTYSGIKKELDSFINICDLYVELLEAEKQPQLLKIIKAKIIGDALFKITPITDINTWADLKKKLKTKIGKRVSLEFAQEDLNNVTQTKDESIEQFGNKVKTKLRDLNESIKEITENEAEMIILKKVNEKNAISKFEQNLRNNNIKILVSAAGKKSLDDSITYALQKELLEKNKNPDNCAICGLNNHNESTCRRKKNATNYNKFNKNNQKNDNYKRSQPFNQSINLLQALLKIIIKERIKMTMLTINFNIKTGVIKIKITKTTENLEMEIIIKM